MKIAQAARPAVNPDLKSQTASPKLSDLGEADHHHQHEQHRQKQLNRHHRRMTGLPADGPNASQPLTAEEQIAAVARMNAFAQPQVDPIRRKEIRNAIYALPLRAGAEEHVPFAIMVIEQHFERAAIARNSAGSRVSRPKQKQKTDAELLWEMDRAVRTLKTNPQLLGPRGHDIMNELVSERGAFSDLTLNRVHPFFLPHDLGDSLDEHFPFFQHLGEGARRAKLTVKRHRPPRRDKPFREVFATELAYLYALLCAPKEPGRGETIFLSFVDDIFRAGEIIVQSRKKGSNGKYVFGDDGAPEGWARKGARIGIGIRSHRRRCRSYPVAVYGAALRCSGKGYAV